MLKEDSKRDWETILLVLLSVIGLGVATLIFGIPEPSSTNPAIISYTKPF